MSEISGAIYRPEEESLKCGFLSITKPKIPSNMITAQLSQHAQTMNNLQFT